jgi:hypothetical protein
LEPLIRGGLETPRVVWGRQRPIDLLRPVARQATRRRCGNPPIFPAHERIRDYGIKNRVDTIRVDVIKVSCQFRLSFRSFLSSIGPTREPGCVGHPGSRFANWPRTLRKSIGLRVRGWFAINWPCAFAYAEGNSSRCLSVTCRHLDRLMRPCPPRRTTHRSSANVTLEQQLPASAFSAPPALEIFTIAFAHSTDISISEYLRILW